MNLTTSVFRKQLGFWTLHCTLNALPSLSIALVQLQLWRNPMAIAAMLLAICTFIFFYTVATSFIPGLSQGQHLIARSIKLGAKIRACISLVTLILLICKMEAMMITPDFWCGFYASIIVGQVMNGFGGTALLMDNSLAAGFGEVFATTLMEGFILSVILLMLSFLVLVVLQMRVSRRAFDPGRDASVTGVNATPPVP